MMYFSLQNISEILYIKEMNHLTTIFPEYFPSIRTFQKMSRSDVVFILDDRPLRSGGKMNRMSIKTSAGKHYLTVPVYIPLHKKPIIRNLSIDSTRFWRKKHSKSLLVNYRNAPYFEHYWPVIETIFLRDYSDYMELFYESISVILSILNMNPRFVTGSGFHPAGSREEQILGILKKESCRSYLIEAGSEAYFDGSVLEENGYSCVKVPDSRLEYPQQFLGFESNLSVLDLVMNLGPETKYYLMKN